MPNTSFSYLLACCVLCALGARAQPVRLLDFSPQFEVFDLPGEEPGNFVQCVAQDALGVLWFGTADGLQRYDGRSITTFRNDPLQDNSLSGGYVQWICAAKDGTLWVADYGRGLTRYDQATGRFTRYRHHPADPNSLSCDTVSMIVEDRQGYIWLGTHHGLNRLDPKTGQFKRFFSDPANPGSLSANLVRALYMDRQGTLWVGCGFPWDVNDPEGKTGGLNRYHPDTETFTRYLHDPANPKSLADNRVRALFEDSRGNFWVGSMGNEGLQRLDRSTGQFTRLPSDPANPGKLSTPFLRSMPLDRQNLRQVLSILEDKNGWLWIGSMSGLDIYDPATGAVRHFETGKGASSLPMNFLWNLSQSRDGIIWIGGGITGGKALKVHSDKPLFTFHNTSAVIVGLNDIQEDDSGNLWLAGGGLGPNKLVRYDRTSGQMRAVPLGETGSDLYNAFSIVQDPGGHIWACTQNGLYRIDPKTNAIVKHYRHQPNNPHSLSTDITTNILKDRQGYYWVTTWGGGLHRFDPKTEKFQRFLHDPAVPGSIGGNQTFGLYEDAQGNIWVGGGTEPYSDEKQNPMFLDRYDPETGTFTHLLGSDECGCACTILGDKKGNLWVLTMIQGLAKVNIATGQIKKYTPSNSNIPTNYLRSVAQAPDGKLWLTTKDALVEFDPESEFFYAYDASHGIQTREIGFMSTFISKKGEIYFGVGEGFYTFLPQKMARSETNGLPEIRITGFKLANEPITPGPQALLRRPVWQTEEIRLSHDQNVFAFNVTCFNFRNPAGNRLEFMLENYDKNWRNDLRDNEAAYFNVPPGEYVFRVRGANSLGVWNVEGASIRIVVRPPWWQTPWAYLLYAALAFGIIFGAYRFLLHRRLAQAESERLKELDAVKTRLYTNITHEFRTPLTVISGMSDQIRENPSEWLDQGTRMIKRNSNRLLDLVNQMLDLAKLESGKMALHLQPGDVVGYLRYLVESFHSYAQSKGVQIHFLSDAETLDMHFDPERLQQVVGNLISNAVKFTPAGGHVYLDLRFENTDSGLKNGGANGRLKAAGDSRLVIRVRDTGVGIPEEHLPYVFDRFYQASPGIPAANNGSSDASYRAEGGTGIGLALTRELVKLMGGEIVVKSQASKGAEFVVTLPIRQDAENARTTHDDWRLERENAAGYPPFSFENQIENTVEIVSPAAGKPATGKSPSTESPLILLAEDNPDVVSYLASCLAGDYRLAVARDGQEAIEIANEIVPDLLVTDVMMPRKDGFEVCRTLRADARTSHIPIVMLTAKADMDSKLEGLEHGADAYLAKPFNKAELRLRIRKLLEMRQKLQQHYLAAAGLTEGSIAQKDLPVLSGEEDRFVRKVREIVERHLDNSAFDVEQLCREMAMSHSQLHRKLSALTGLAATKFVRHVRLSKARELLQDPATTISAVAYDTGFTDPSYFGRVFRQELGMSPQEWRERNL
ncbi:MAG: response regulator [Lewinellaceae bacterium]|nr:response regulator [Lewinellaceae bacterium]